MVILITLVLLFPVMVVDKIFQYFEELRPHSFPLQVKIDSQKKRKIERISAGTLQYRDWAERFKANPSAYQDKLEPVQWHAGSPFIVPVQYTSSKSFFVSKKNENPYHYIQNELLILVVEYADGKTEYVTGAIPDGRYQRDLVVKVP